MRRHLVELIRDLNKYHWDLNKYHSDDEKLSGAMFIDNK